MTFFSAGGKLAVPVGGMVRKGLRYLVVAVSVWFLVLGVKFSLVDRDPAAGLGVIAMSVFAFGISLFLDSAQNNEPFLAWLADNRNAVENGSAVFEGHPIGKESLCVRYQGCTALIIWSGQYASPWRPIIVENRDQAVYTLVTLLTGWWSIGGLIWAPKSLIANAKGGEKATVGELLG